MTAENSGSTGNTGNPRNPRNPWNPGSTGRSENTESAGHGEHGMHGYAGPEGQDALMAAILGEPPPPGALRDPSVRDEHGAAAADVAALREQLVVIGDALAGEAGAAPAGQAAVTPLAGRRPRRPLKAALGALAAAAAAALVVSVGWLAPQAGVSGGDAGGGSAADSAPGESSGPGVLFGSPRYLACARTVAEGTVSAVRPASSGGVERVTLTVRALYKTEDGRTGELSFPVRTAEAPPLRTGDRVLVGIPRNNAFPDTVLVGEERIAPARSRLAASLPESRTLGCP